MKTIIDYLKFRTQKTPQEIFWSLGGAFGVIDDDELLDLQPEQDGKDGWKFRRWITMGGERVAVIDYGGESQNGWARFTMSGEGCRWVQDWSKLHAALIGLSAEIRRVDIALTVADGSITHGKVLGAFKRGEFVNSGRGPKLRQVTGSDPRMGRTIYIGARDSAKMCRAYEKGFEMMNKAGVPEYIASRITNIEFAGNYVDVRKLYRVEVEFKAEDCLIPLDIISERDSYFSGAYPFCKKVLGGSKTLQVLSLPNRGAGALLVQAEHCRKAYGGLIKALYDQVGADQTLQMLMADEPSDRLVRNGAITATID